jgi:hypothetical protein
MATDSAAISEGPKEVVSIGGQNKPRRAPKDRKPLECDQVIYRLVVIWLGLVMLTSMGGSLALAWVNGADKIPDIFVALGSAAVGALAGLLAPSPKSS